MRIRPGKYDSSLVFREDFFSSQRVIDNGGVAAASIVFANKFDGSAMGNTDKFVYSGKRIAQATVASAFTLLVDFDRPTIDGRFQTLVSLSTGVSSTRIWEFGVSNTGYIYGYITGVGVIQFNLAASGRHRYAFVVSGNSVTVYSDGSQVSTTGSFVRPGYTSDTVLWAGSCNASSQQFKSNIYSFRIHNTAFTAEEVLDDYQSNQRSNNVMASLLNEGVVVSYCDFTRGEVIDRVIGDSPVQIRSAGWGTSKGLLGITLNSSDSRIRYEDAPGRRLSGPQMTIFIKASPFAYNGSGVATLVSKWVGADLSFNWSLSTSVFEFYDSLGVSRTIANTSKINTAAITLVNGSTATAYVDGRSIGAYSGSSTVNSSAARFDVGSMGILNGYQLRGQVQCLAMFSRVLTAVEIMQVHRHFTRKRSNLSSKIGL